MNEKTAEPGTGRLVGPGTLVLAGTPIGDSTQVSPQLRRAFAEADVIAAEDTRLLRTLLARAGVETGARIVSYFEGNEAERTPRLIGELSDGAVVVVATDAGMPSISDPGFRLVRAAIEAGLRVTSVPGPSAVTTALAVSGLPCDRFCFEGFLPRAGGPRRRRLAALAGEERTMVFFEAPHRLVGFLDDAVAAFGADRPGVLCRELTKPWEDVIRGPLGRLRDWAAEHARGETTLVIAGRPADPGGGLAEALAQVDERIAAGERLSQAVTRVAAETGVRRKDLYQAALAARDEQ
ncbi:16S rRNA (cytidine(1402)-2'-O)-methyltransferase [Propionibacterium australiense]|uniref:Ribosomal RNA small subunit methyltransferase I n=1 Tax=Propionibacterium australiense TaxID=119981 RepID=A0A383S7X0_9ACTN|nr:16S rRNA (cytidine(1402)-2'-O)-methyltransferase [Propionibacterium australiense]RLP09519.1 16S rRNA (cytidine(1402)-2'-O)-methyltransferase [Propionibacterium australiense]RLP09901.1 16S rRNA (cytidine(1402)-2'-O)-methyltransferase [Propionibacterium australiense]SYZ33811.1 16S rRNA (cytidine1402-2'-O)-methyltransferase [Propionibacterium australiense]VEH91939.1 Ribosomal RNA small subunit methyltransferase I [Propionibacterium australiense]